MGFEESANKSLQYNRGQLRNKSVFERAEPLSNTHDATSSGKRKLSEEALLRIKKGQRKNLQKSIAALVIFLALTFGVFWYFLL